jgi:hypothetical protein
MIDDSTGVPVSIPAAADRSVQCVGTFDTATISMQGSNDGTTWFELNAIQNFTTAIASTADASPGIQQIGENVLWIRPLEAGGAGSVAVNVYLLCRNG